jgi:hypothetical protein
MPIRVKGYHGTSINMPTLHFVLLDLVTYEKKVKKF